jgi:hypothetical protein
MLGVAKWSICDRGFGTRGLPVIITFAVCTLERFEERSTRTKSLLPPMV